MMWQIMRPPPPRPYAPSSKVLVASRTALAATEVLLRKAGRHEACCFWYGSRSEVSIVLGVAAPRQISRPRNYTVPGEAIAEVVDRLPDNEWRILAQVHSHPGDDVEHSVYDDEMAISRTALSLVVPRYASSPVSWDQEVGVHEFQIDYWHKLTRHHASTRLISSDEEQCWVRDFR